MSTKTVNSEPAMVLPTLIDIDEPTGTLPQVMSTSTMSTEPGSNLEEDVSQKLLRLVREQFHAIVALKSQVSTLDQLTKSLREELGQMQQHTDQRFAEESAARLDLEGRLSLAMREAAQEVLKQDMNFETPDEVQAREQLESRLQEAMKATESLKEEFPQLNWGASPSQRASALLQPSPKTADDVANVGTKSISQVCRDASMESLDVELDSPGQDHDQRLTSGTPSQKNPLQMDVEKWTSKAICDIHNEVDGKLKDITEELAAERAQRISQHDMFMGTVSRIEKALNALNEEKEESAVSRVEVPVDVLSQEKAEGSCIRNGSRSPRVPSPGVPGPFIPVAQVARPAVVRRISATRNRSQSPRCIQHGVVVNAPQLPSRATLGIASPRCPPPQNLQVNTCAPYHANTQRATSQPKTESAGATSPGCPHPMNAPPPGVTSPRCPPHLNAVAFIPPCSQHATTQGGEVIANLVQQTTSQPQMLVPSLAYPSANAGEGRYTAAPNTNQAAGSIIAHPMSARMSSQEALSQAPLHSGSQRRAVSQASLHSGIHRQEAVSQGSFKPLCKQV